MATFDRMDSSVGGGDANDLSAQALVAALQAKVQGDVGAATDPEVQAVLAPLLAALQQAHAAMEIQFVPKARKQRQRLPRQLRQQRQAAQPARWAQQRGGGECGRAQRFF